MHIVLNSHIMLYSFFSLLKFVPNKPAMCGYFCSCCRYGLIRCYDVNEESEKD